MPARIIFKAHYLSGEKSNHIENYIQYMGTRPGVEIFDDDGSPATEKQEELIAQLTEDFGKEMTDTFEYEDYLAKPTKANASALITACLDTQYGNTATKENYIDYIANRPRVEKLGEHGLFAQTDAPLDLDEIAHEVAHQGNNVWTDVISLRREDAAATGFDNAAAWRDLLRSKAETIARNYKIPMRDFVWYAAFHDEGHHPHVHFVCYSEGRDGYLTEKGIENIKSSLAHEIFRQEFSEIYDRQTQLRTELKDESTQLMERIARSMADGMHENTELTESVIALAERIDGLSGKKQYGYLPKDAKALVDTVVGELAQHEAIATLYDLWYEQKEQILGMYKEKMPEKLFLLSAEQENAYAQYQLGKLYLSGNDSVVQDNEAALAWFQKSAEQNNASAQYALGKIYLSGEIAPKDVMRAKVLFEKSAGQGNAFAAYQLGKLYWNGEELDRNPEKAIAWWTKAAEQENPYACSALGKIYRNGTDAEADSEKAEKYFRSAYQGFLEIEKTEPNDNLEYRLGKMLYTGMGVEKDDAAAEVFFQKSAEAGNVYAQYELAMLWLNDETKDTDKAVSLLTESADGGNVTAQYALGKLYLEGEVIQKDVLRAEKLFLKAAEQGNAFAQYQLGKLYLGGEDSVKKDTGKAVWWLEKSAEQNNSFAQYQLGNLYLNGDGVPKDISKAESYLLASAEQENPYAMYRYGCLLRDEYEANEEALRWIEKAAMQEHPGALYTLCAQDMAAGNFPQAFTYLNRLECLDRKENSYIAYYLGKLYLMDENRLKDVPKAIAFLQEAAEQENDMALYTLGKLYLADKDVPKNILFAVSCLERAAKLENSYAEYQLGQLYIRGVDVPQDIARGLEFLNSAADKNNDMALYALGKLHLAGENGVPQNVGKALDCFHRAADLDNAAACYQLGKIYLEGVYVQKDVGTALVYLEKSASLESDAAMFALGNLYLKGEDVPKDVTLAVRYFKAAADRGNDFAMYQLGKLYFLGEELPQDVQLGIRYMEQAIAKGNDTAMCFLGRAYLVGENVPKDIQKGLELLRIAANCGNEYAEKMLENFRANAAHTAISILHKLSLILQSNTSALMAKRPAMPAVDKKELLAILRKKEEQGIRYD